MTIDSLRWFSQRRSPTPQKSRPNSNLRVIAPWVRTPKMWRWATTLGKSAQAVYSCWYSHLMAFRAETKPRTECIRLNSSRYSCHVYRPTSKRVAVITQRRFLGLRCLLFLRRRRQPRVRRGAVQGPAELWEWLVLGTRARCTRAATWAGESSLLYVNMNTLVIYLVASLQFLSLCTQRRTIADCTKWSLL